MTTQAKLARTNGNIIRRGVGTDIMRASVSRSLQEKGQPIWQRATDHPMVREIGEGSLPHAKFRFYFSQNILYLEDYARALGLIIGKAPDREAIDILSRFLERISGEEIPANYRFFEQLGGDVSTIDALSTMAPTTYAYTRHLLYVASQGDCAAGLTAILPCQWSYGELAKPLVKQLPQDPIYAEWIGIFGKEGYDDLVAETTGLLDRLADPTDEAQVRQLSWIFDTSTRYEVMFWDMAYEDRSEDGTLA
jgi:thiaminase/transcriptional activator TenA